MEPAIRELAEKKLIGMCVRMSMSSNRTMELWKSFMPRRKEISNVVTTSLFSMQIYDPGHDHSTFHPQAAFDKWAAVEVSDFNRVPEGMKTFVLKAGTYVVFLHRGAASEGARTFGYIFGTWLPASDYCVDDRPHFELLGEKYKNDSPDSEEEIWIPVRKK